MPARRIPDRPCSREPRPHAGSVHRAFDKGGIKIIDPAGQPFDPEWHEAMAVQESREHPANTVLSVIQKGYSPDGRLLRPARVIVSKNSWRRWQLKMPGSPPL